MMPLAAVSQDLPEWWPKRIELGELNLELATSAHRLKGITLQRGGEIDVQSVKSSGFGFDQLHLPIGLRLLLPDMSGALSSSDNALRIAFKWDPKSERLSARANALGFADGGLQPSTLLPPLSTYLKDVAGEVTLSGHWSLDGSAGFDSRFDGLALKVFDVPIGSLDGALNFISLKPMETPGAQTIQVGGIKIGKLEAAIDLTFDAKDDIIHFLDAQASLGESALRLENTQIDVFKKTASGLLHIDGLNLSNMSEQLALDGLDVMGWIGGSLPFSVNAEGIITINQGLLASASPGIINYRPAQSPAALAGDDESLLLVRQALENFHFSKMQITMNGSSDGAMTIGLNLAGANPELYGGYPLEFNLALDGALALLAQQAVGAYQIPDKLSRRLLDFLDR